MDEYEDPLAMVDVALFTIKDGKLSFLVAKRKDPKEPYCGMKGLPGARIRTEEDETAYDAVKRVVRTKLGFEPPHLEQLHTFSGRKRDPRRWSLSVAHYSVVPAQVLEQTNIEGLEWVPADDPLEMPFDHNEIVSMALQRLRNKSTYSSLLTFLLPDEFTIPELHRVYELVTKTEQNISSFRKKVLDQKIIEFTGRQRRGGKHKPPDLYRRIQPGLQEFKRTI